MHLSSTMITPRSFIYSRQRSSAPSYLSDTNNTNITTTTTTTTTIANANANNSTAGSSIARKNEKHPSLPLPITTVRPTATSINTTYPCDKPARSSENITATMATASVARPTTPSSAVQIPVKQKSNSAHKQQNLRHHTDAHRRRSSRSCSSSRSARDARSAEPLPPSVAQLLAITSIPPPQRRGSLRQRSKNDGRMTVDSIVPRSQVSEKELSQELDGDLENGSLPSYSRSPMEVLLSPPDELEEDEVSLSSDYGYNSGMPSRVASLESVPSLGDSLGTSGVPSVDSPLTPRGRRSRPPRRSLEPLTSPPGEHPGDPLSLEAVDELDFNDFIQTPATMAKAVTPSPSPLKSVFKSNLTASLRALRSAARSLSTFTASSVPPDDFLTRSIFTMDPKVPFTDERMPPALEDEPSDAMRRYLNPPSNTYNETHPSSSVRNYTASIQMQTYKIQRSKSAPPSRSGNTSPGKASTALVFPPGPRQREMRENSDFIRIAVMEHLMRKRGKLDDQRDGHARWLLPPRKAVSGTYEVGVDGVPTRWVSVSQDTI